MSEVSVIELKFVPDDLESSATRTHEVRNLISQMIEMSHRRGRPAKQIEEISDAA